MKRFFKQFLAMMLVFIIVLSISPLQVGAAAKKNITISKTKKATVKSVMYKGAKPTTATFSMNCKKTKTGVTVGSNKYDIYNITLTLNSKKLSGSYAAKAVKQMNAIGQHVYTFQPIVIDKKGKMLKNVVSYAYLDKNKSSNTKVISGTVNGKRYSLYDWRQKEVYQFQLSIPQKTKECYIGFAGLRNGQIKTSLDQKFTNGKIDYYAAGFGSSKKGFIVVKKVK